MKYLCTYRVTEIVSVTVDANSEEEAKQIADETPWDDEPEVVGTTLIACEEVGL